MNKLIFTTLIILCHHSVSSQGISLTDAYKEDVVNEITKRIQEAYVYEDLANEMAAHLVKLEKQGTFKAADSYKSFAKALNDAAFEICNDKHFRIRATDNTNNQSRRMKSISPAIESQWLGDGIGLVTVNTFMTSQAEQKIDKAMDNITGAKTLIFDIRENQGGSPQMVQYLCSYLFEGKVLLNSLYWRARDHTDRFYTRSKVGGVKAIDADVYLLVSNKTFSAAEEFAYNLQSRKRAILIGEITGGGAHPVNSMRIDKNITMVLPIGRAINPVTNSNWEGTGVIPEIKVPKEQALDVALRRIQDQSE